MLTDFLHFSAYIMWISINHNDVHGPKSAKFGEEAKQENPAEGLAS